ncbi:hypothetical protein A2334_00235 [Candidatus Roizmanbacteria bacterium RIFOXYB2_FULL_38_10]|uniref:Carboxypeptidase regulatory-like domain-containing protein n=1 Tax=Candidatus Roizmanbacteria bacterium RIFOXYD1_FULL_38_12 TaxID=1802093 RepID=A0A1F7L283_9BACT|nr:MAG: hypothetical protein A3K47_05780 [Candidatus Roizmanbacteria bacterium RIFOXYA2_FULL_38_14]OGK64252.1 MAG: hypothetical protein A3K27_05780 [Candidatus Roizmanbacteria bacterium RIFOXYA1_FULL_37_12]OGK66098.1 MAG: hypothetical protein A3K38_05780 [Candidatus Roizmanbacteria bacterium RIFOXYB1_FULL_40_23]OGK67663.1 MAG: hypothetical protein A2334_00235 [Candidatus Roizmanbacteria bacterium RIFOXYB2_FULL_38_10]OGK70503.1 MAG: hypothetical protein A3K21_05785 [Candidatus Roizmanbacteria ba
MACTKKTSIITSFLILLVTLSFFSSKSVQAAQTPDVCYSQCLAYKFVWQGTHCFDEFEYHCTEDSGSTFKKTIAFLKDVFNTLKSGDGIDTVFTAWFVCKPLIENCIVPHQQNCRQTCNLDQYVYAPDLSVGHPDSSFHGVYFDERFNRLYFKLVNNGMGYAWDIDVDASSGHTPNRDGKIQGGTQLFKEKVEHLIYLGARNGPPKSFSDTVGDFLIEESLNGQYLHDFKSWLVDKADLHSDSKNYNVPNYWIKAVPFNPVPGELNRVIFNVDGSKLIPEYSESNNTFIFDLDLRPTPARYTIATFTQQIIDQTLNSFLINFQVKNTGEESGLAQAKIYEGKFQEGKTPIYQSEENIMGKSDKNFEATIDVNLSGESSPYCGKHKEYTIVVTDEEGNKTERSFSLPIYIGSVNGNVEDLFGKPVVGATVKASTGQETTTNKYGSYSLKGIASLGKIVITATHSEFSRPGTQEVELKYVNEFDACDVGNLNFYNIDLVLKDQDVLFTVTVKDQSGNPIIANILAVNSDWRFYETINGTGPLPGMQPGKYLFTISASGYKTIRQDINAVPQNVNLEFILEKLNGRPDDTGLHLITPRLLWQKTFGLGSGKEIGNMTGTKNGQLLVISVADNHNKTRKLFFLDLLTGNQTREVSVPWSVEEQRYIGLDASYDGGTVGFFINTGSGKTRESILKLFDATGNEIGSTTFDRDLSASMDVSPDGFYVCSYLLLDKGLHKYTGYEIEGKGDDDFKRNPATCPDYFLRNNHRVTNCKDGLCEETISHNQVRVIGDITNITTVTKYDSTFDDSTVVARTHKTLYYFGQSNWSKELRSDNSYKSIAVSPGGMYTIVTEGSGGSLKLKVFDRTGGDKTPDFPYKHVRFVFANDKGLFFTQLVSNRIELYKIGEYDNEYRPPDLTPTVIPQWFDGLSYYSQGQFFPSRDNTFASLDPGVMYRADKNIQMSIIKPFSSVNLGTLSITKDTIFSVNYNYNPILIKGQMTANFGSPVTIYAIKFDRYWTGNFKVKLEDFMHHMLPEDEYFIIQNIHTRFTIKNEANSINVAVDSGDVAVKGKNIEEKVSGNNQITIDGKNNIKKSLFISIVVYRVVGLIWLLSAGILLFIKRKTLLGKRILQVMKVILIWTWILVKKISVLIWKGLKILSQLIIGLIKKTSKNKKK